MPWNGQNWMSTARRPKIYEGIQGEILFILGSAGESLSSNRSRNLIQLPFPFSPQLPLLNKLCFISASIDCLIHYLV
jgi:hypothetical protein